MAMTVLQAIDFFQKASIRKRLKLANELHKTGNIYILDEPTVGLHSEDISSLLTLLDQLVDRGKVEVMVGKSCFQERHRNY